ncbi:MAG: Hsp70 family protein [Candidatus Brocadiia bacterium]
MRLGIDYGTTNTVVVCSDRGRYPVVLHMTETAIGPVAREVFPSAVVYDRQTGRLIFGADVERCLCRPGAEEQYALIESPKRLMRDYAEGLRFRRDIRPEGFDAMTIVGEFAQALRESVLRSGLFPENEPLETVITWPTNANGAQRYVTRQCFKKAGFDVLDALNEPSAAAIEFADRMNRGNRILARRFTASAAIFDLGGGTFDAALVQIAEGNFRVVASGGVERLGGDDFDEILARRFAREFGTTLEELPPFPRSLLLMRARQIKENISSGAGRWLTLSAEDAGLSGGIARVPVAEYFADLSVLLEPALEKLHGLINGEAARQAGITTETLVGIYLVGGSSKLPLVPHMIARRFPGVRLIVSDKPFSSTATGAAIHGAESVRLQDILSRNFGVMRLADYGRREYFAPVFKAGMPLPQRGAAALRSQVRYAPRHNIGHLRYLECAGLDSAGRPSEGVRAWSELLFPYDPAIPIAQHLEPGMVRDREDLHDKWVCETYSCDSDGVITVSIQRLCDDQSRTYEVFQSQ